VVPDGKGVALGLGLVPAVGSSVPAVGAGLAVGLVLAVGPTDGAGPGPATVHLARSGLRSQTSRAADGVGRTMPRYPVTPRTTSVAAAAPVQALRTPHNS
jgi:hypothetical protein